MNRIADATVPAWAVHARTGCGFSKNSVASRASQGGLYDMDRKNISFEQAEGALPLPAQLKLKELSQELRARLWHEISKAFSQASGSSEASGS
jgi:hypothetical protein